VDREVEPQPAADDQLLHEPSFEIHLMIPDRLVQPFLRRVAPRRRQAYQRDQRRGVVRTAGDPVLRRDLQVPQREAEAVAERQGPVAEAVGAVDDRAGDEVHTQGVVREQERVSEADDVEGRRIARLQVRDHLGDRPAAVGAVERHERRSRLRNAVHRLVQRAAHDASRVEERLGTALAGRGAAVTAARDVGVESRQGRVELVEETPVQRARVRDALEQWIESEVRALAGEL